MVRLFVTVLAVIGLVFTANAGVIIDAGTNHGSFESPETGDPDDSGDTVGTRVNQVTGWTAVDTGWSMFTHSSYVSKSVTDGEYGLSVNNGVSALVTSDPIAVSFAAGGDLTMTFDMGNNAVGNDTLFQGYAYFDGGAAVSFAEGQVTSTTDLGGGLYRDVYSDTITVPVNATSLVIEFGVQNGGAANDQAYMDNMNVSYIPEPGTLALLGLGGLALALRRRR